MRGSADETVGEEFSVELLQQARDKTLQVIEEAASLMKPGTTESEAKALILEIQTRLGGPKNWHPPQVRFGVNSVLGFNEKPTEGVALGENDIYFFDIGPIFSAHEGDVGRTFTLGKNPEFERCRVDVEAIWNEVRAHWREHRVAGPDLYKFAEERARARGWKLSVQNANGHRIADFPHAARGRGSIEGFPASPAPNRWILEIQIRHPEKPFGAFFEDLLQ